VCPYTIKRLETHFRRLWGRTDLGYVWILKWTVFLELGVMFIPYCTPPLPKFGYPALLHHRCLNSLVLIYWPVIQLHTWLPSQQKLYMPRVFSPRLSFKGQRKLEILQRSRPILLICVMKKLRAVWSQGIRAIIWCRMFRLSVCYPNAELQFFLTFVWVWNLVSCIEGGI
jgi:hypothetical protein